MAKYVCDFDTVRDTCQKMDDTAAKLGSEIRNYLITVEGQLNWDGTARENFNNSLIEQSTLILQNVADLENMSGFLKFSADSIESLENELASQDI